MSSQYNTAPQPNPEKAWRDQCQALANELPRDHRYPIYSAHREAFIQAYPGVEVKRIYNPELEPSFTYLNGDHPANIDYTLQDVQGKDALVVTASGFAWLNALTRGVEHVDNIDKNPRQGAWLYTQAAFIAMTPRESLPECLSILRMSDYNSYDLKSMELVPLRKYYLDNFSEICVALGAPTESLPFIAHALSHFSFEFDQEMQKVIYPNGTTLWDAFLANYDIIRRRIVDHEGWDVHTADLNTWLKNHPNRYGAIHTSNVFDWVDPPISVDDFVANVSYALEPGGVGNVATMLQNMRELTQSIHPTDFRIKHITSRDDKAEGSKDFLALQKIA